MYRFANEFHKKALEVSNYDSKVIEERPILIFNSSTRIATISQNASFSLITSWCLRLAGYRVVNVVCKYGTNCLFNVDRNNDTCERCFDLSKEVFAGAETEFINAENKDEDQRKSELLSKLSLEELMKFTPFKLPLGQIVLPSVRWILKQHTLNEDEETLRIYRKYLLSAWYLEKWVGELYKRRNPLAVIVFNGTFFSEAIFRLVAINRNIRVITHEIGSRSLSAFFTEGLATEYPINVPQNYILSEDERKVLTDFINRRKKGNFKTAGIKFWPKMKHLSNDIKSKIIQYEQCVTIFTNVVFDTSQTNANTIYSNMFNWLDDILIFIPKYKNTLFIIRAHPDENRPGKVSKESVRDWYIKRDLSDIENLLFIEPQNYISSYELIDISKFVLVYNSTIGLEASALGKLVLCGAKSRYSNNNTVVYPSSKSEYRHLLKKFITLPINNTNIVRQINSMNFLYFQTFVYSLPFKQYIYSIKNGPGHVGLKKFHVDDLLEEKSQLARVLIAGIINKKDFVYKWGEDL